MKAEDRQVNYDLRTKVEWIQMLILLDSTALAIPEPFGYSDALLTQYRPPFLALPCLKQYQRP
jgi:hypothetical protein